MATTLTAPPTERTKQAVILTQSPVMDHTRGGGRPQRGIVLMSGVESQEQIPLLDTHQNSSIKHQFGSVRAVRIGSDQVTGTLNFSPDADSLSAWQKVDSGDVDSVSAGFRVIESEFVQPGQTRTYDGLVVHGGTDGVRVYTRTRLQECSLCPIGSDPAAKIRSELDERGRGFIVRTGHIGTRGRTSSAGPTLSAAPAASSTKGNGKMTAATATPRRSPQVVDSKSATQTYHDSPRAMTAGLLQRTNNPMPKSDDPAEQRENERFADVGQVWANRNQLQALGHYLRMKGMEKPDGPYDLLARAFSIADVQEAYQATAGASVESGFREAPDTTRGWTQKLDAKSYGVLQALLTGSTETPALRPRGQAAEHSTADIWRETFRIASYATQWSLDDQDILDDDLSAIDSIPRAKGMAAARLRPDLVYSLVLANPTLNQDSVALFAAGHSNLVAANFTAAAFNTGSLAIRNQSVGGVSSQSRRSHLITPGDNEDTARQELKNIADRLEDIDLTLLLEDRLGPNGVTDPSDGTAYTGGATHWLLVAADSPTIGVAYLDGRETPRVDMWVENGGSWGVGWSVELSIGVVARDFRGMYLSTGS